MTAATPEFRWRGVGRRKTSVARVYLLPGTGKWEVNGRTLGDYFPRPSLVQHIGDASTSTWGGRFHTAPDFDREWRAAVRVRRAG